MLDYQRWRHAANTSDIATARHLPINVHNDYPDSPWNSVLSSTVGRTGAWASSAGMHGTAWYRTARGII